MASLSKSERPKINIPLQSLDYALEILAAWGLLGMIGLATFYYGQLPEQIPTHFGPSGQPDAFGSKNSLWMLPIIGTAIFALMTFLNRRPDWFNYPAKITAENAERQYTMGVRLIRFLKATVMLLFAYLVWGTINIANGGAEKLSSWILILPLLTVGSVLFFFYSSASKK
jgi:uncharacterized membrane protein